MGVVLELLGMRRESRREWRRWSLWLAGRRKVKMVLELVE